MPTITTSGLATARGFGMLLPQKNSIPLPDIGSAIEGGFYVGSIRIGAINYALIMAPQSHRTNDRVLCNQQLIPTCK